MWCNPFVLGVCELWTITIMRKIAGCSRSRDGRIGFEEVHKCVLESPEWCDDGVCGQIQEGCMAGQDDRRLQTACSCWLSRYTFLDLNLFTAFVLHWSYVTSFLLFVVSFFKFMLCVFWSCRKEYNRGYAGCCSLHPR